MKMQLIRNATIKLAYGNKTFLIDPYFSEKHAQPSFGGKSRNPIVDLPFPVKEVMKWVDYYMISHTHPDHSDHKAQEIIPKDAKILCQPSDVPQLSGLGFQQLIPVHDKLMLDDIEIIRTQGRHGDRQEEELVKQIMGEVSGFIFRHKHEPTVYWMGDTIWYKGLEELVKQYKPDIIICHSGGNMLPADSPILGGHKLARSSGSLIMDKGQTLALCRFAKASVVVATHLGALDHEMVTRKELRAFAKRHDIDEKAFLIPEDGETFSFSLPKEEGESLLV